MPLLLQLDDVSQHSCRNSLLLSAGHVVLLLAPLLVLVIPVSSAADATEQYTELPGWTVWNNGITTTATRMSSLGGSSSSNKTTVKLTTTMLPELNLRRHYRRVRAVVQGSTRDLHQLRRSRQTKDNNDRRSTVTATRDISRAIDSTITTDSSSSSSRRRRAVSDSPPPRDTPRVTTVASLPATDGVTATGNIPNIVTSSSSSTSSCIVKAVDWMAAYERVKQLAEDETVRVVEYRLRFTDTRDLSVADNSTSGSGSDSVSLPWRLYDAGRWSRVHDLHSLALQSIAASYDVISLRTLAVGSELLEVDVRDEPAGCVQLLDELSRCDVILHLLLRDFQVIRRYIVMLQR